MISIAISREIRVLRLASGLFVSNRSFPCIAEVAAKAGHDPKPWAIRWDDERSLFNGALSAREIVPAPQHRQRVAIPGALLPGAVTQFR